MIILLFFKIMIQREPWCVGILTRLRRFYEIAKKKKK
jgi:hypothetical protein